MTSYVPKVLVLHQEANAVPFRYSNDLHQWSPNW